MGPSLSFTIIAIGVSSVIIGWMAITIRLRLAMLVVGAMFMASALGVGVNYSGIIWTQWLHPVQEYRSEMFLLGGFILALGILSHLKEAEFGITGTQAWLLLIMALYQGVMRLYHDSAFSGFSTIGGALVTIYPLMIIVPMMIRRRAHVYGMLRLFLWVHVLYLIGCGVQLVINPNRLVIDWHNRFLGLTGQTQHAAVYLAIVSVIGLWAILNDDEWRYRWIWTLSFGLSVILLIGTGSRTGAGLLVVGMTAILYRRLGRMVLFLPIGALVVFGGLKLIGATGLEMPYDRVISLQDTRSVAWLDMIDEIRRNPLLGTGLVNLTASENSYLRGWAAFGGGFALLMVALMALSVWNCLRLMQLRRFLPSWRAVIDLMIGLNAMYFAGAVFEGYILGRANTMLFTMLIVSGLTAVLFHAVRVDDISLLEGEPEFEAGDAEDFAEAGTIEAHPPTHPAAQF